MPHIEVHPPMEQQLVEKNASSDNSLEEGAHKGAAEICSVSGGIAFVGLDPAATHRSNTIELSSSIHLFLCKIPIFTV